VRETRNVIITITIIVAVLCGVATSVLVSSRTARRCRSVQNSKTEVRRGSAHARKEIPDEKYSNRYVTYCVLFLLRAIV